VRQGYNGRAADIEIYPYLLFMSFRFVGSDSASKSSSSSAFDALGYSSFKPFDPPCSVLKFGGQTSRRKTLLRAAELTVGNIMEWLMQTNEAENKKFAFLAFR
jgi:hypothetical protein